MGIVARSILSSLILLVVASSPASATSSSQPLGSVMPQLNTAAMPYFQLSPNDLSFRLLYSIFGPIVSQVQNGSFFTLTGPANASFSSLTSPSAITGTASPSANGSTGIGNMMGAFFQIYNVAMLFMASLMILWKLLTHILVTADTGEWLGKKISTFWAPIRMVGGMSMLVPISGGYSLIQGVLIWLVLQGGAIADTEMNAVLTFFANQMNLSPLSQPMGPTLAAQILESATCMIDMNTRVGPQYFSEYPDQGKNPVVIKISSYGFSPNATGSNSTGNKTVSIYRMDGTQIGSPTTTMETGGSGGYTEYDFVENPSYAFDNEDEIAKPICGGVRISIPYQQSNQNSSFLGSGTVTSAPIYSSLYSSMGNAEITALQTAMNDIIPLAGQIATGQISVSSANGLQTTVPYTGPITNNQTINGQINPPASSSSATPPSPNYGAYTTAISDYDTTIQNAEQSAVQQYSTSIGNSIQSVLKGRGWLQLGAIWLEMEKINEEGNNIITDHLTVSAPSIDQTAYPMVYSHMLEASAIANTANNTYNSQIASAGSSAASATKTASLMGSVSSTAGSIALTAISHPLTSVENILSRLLTLPVGIVMEAMGYNVAGDGLGSLFASGNGSGFVTSSIAQNSQTGNPLMNFINGGQRLMIILGHALGMIVIALTLMKAVGLGKIGSFLGGKLGHTAMSAVGDATPLDALGSSLKYLVYFILFLLAVFALIGFALGVWLPSIPLIAWLGAVTGWVLMIAESMMALPLWAIIHSNPEGEGWSPDSAKQGYQLLSGLVLRPSLMVGALFFGMSIMTGMSWLFGMLLQPYMRTLNENSGLGGAIMSLMTILLLVGFLVYICHMSLKLVTKLPDAILRWIGGGNDSLGAAEETQQHMNVIFGKMNFGGMGTEMLRSKLGGGIRDVSHAAVSAVSSGGKGDGGEDQSAPPEKDQGGGPPAPRSGDPGGGHSQGGSGRGTTPKGGRKISSNPYGKFAPKQPFSKKPK